VSDPKSGLQEPKSGLQEPFLYPFGHKTYACGLCIDTITHVMDARSGITVDNLICII